MGVYLRELLSTPLFQTEFRQIAGFTDRDLEISHISVIDTPLVPLPLYSLNDNVFILSSFYLYKDDPAAMLEAVKNLRIMGVSALGIKTDLYINDVPDSMIQFCNEQHFPLFITVKPGIPFRKIISAVEEYIKAADATQTSNNIFEGYLQGNARTMVSKLMNDSFPFNFICLTCDRRTLLKSITFPRPSLEDLNHVGQLFFDQMDQLLSGDDFTIYQGYYLTPCYVRNNLEAILVFQPSQSATAYEIRKAAKTLSTLVSLQLMESILLESGYQQATAALTNDFWFSEYPSEERARQKFYSYGYPNQPYYRVLLCTGIYSSAGDAKESYFLKKSRRSIIVNTLHAYFPGTMCFDLNDQVVALIPIRKNSKYLSDTVFRNTLQDVLDKLKNVPTFEVLFSQNQSRLMRCAYIFRHLSMTQKACGKQRNSRLQLVQDFDPVSLAMAAVDSQQQELIWIRVIQPIQEYDQRYHYSLIETLIFCMETGSLEKAALELHIHTSTLRYRLQKVQALTGYNFFDFQDRVALYIACLLWKTQGDDPLKTGGDC